MEKSNMRAIRRHHRRRLLSKRSTYTHFRRDPFWRNHQIKRYMQGRITLEECEARLREGEQWHYVNLRIAVDTPKRCSCGLCSIDREGIRRGTRREAEQTRRYYWRSKGEGLLREQEEAELDWSDWL